MLILQRSLVEQYMHIARVEAVLEPLIAKGVRQKYHGDVLRLFRRVQGSQCCLRTTSSLPEHGRENESKINVV